MKMKTYAILISVVFLVIGGLNKKITAQTMPGDECYSATTLTNLIKYCSSPQQYTNLNSTKTTSFGPPVCWSKTSVPTEDVWFKFVAIGTDVQMSVAGGGVNGTIKKPNIVLYKAKSCADTISTMACSASNSTDVTSLYKGSLIPGDTYWIRIATTSVNEGSFQFCISNYTPTVNPGADCDGAVKLCDLTVVSVAGLSGGGNNNKEIPMSSCFYDSKNGKQPLESNSSWFKWTCAKAGTLYFDIAPIDPTNDLDFLLYEVNGTATDACATKTVIRCTATACLSPNGMVGLDMSSTDVNEPPNCDPPNTGSDGYLKYINMVVGKTYVLQIDNFSTASGFTITFHGTGLFLGPYAEITAKSSLTSCVGEQITFDGSKSDKYNALKWTFSGGTPTTATSVGPHTITYNTAGTYTTYLKATDYTCNSGNSIDSVKITIKPPTTISDAGSVQTVCGPTATLNANVPTNGTGAWTLYSGEGVVTSPNDPKSGVTGLGKGANVFQWTISNANCKSTTSKVTINSVGIPSKATVGLNQIICGGSSASLTGNIPAMGKGKWTLISGAGVIASAVSPNTLVTSLGFGNNVFRWSISNTPCSDDYADVIIKRVAEPVVDTSKMKIGQPNCNTSNGFINTIKVTAASALTYNWNTISYPSADINNIPAGSYTLVVKDADGCSSTMGPISITNPGAPNQPVLVSAGDVCVGDAIKVWVKNPLPNVTYTWNGPSGNSIGIKDTIYIANAALTDNGKYSATGSFAGCTGATGSAGVLVNPLPIPLITGTTAICPGSNSIFSAINSVPGGTTAISTYQWLYNNQPIAPLGDSVLVNATKPGLYSVVIKNSKGCVDTSQQSELKFNTPPVIDESEVVVINTNCNSPTGGVIKIKVVGGVPVLNYTWFSPPAINVFSSTTTTDLVTMPAGEYFMIVSDGNNCKDTSSLFKIENYKIPNTPGVTNNVSHCDGDQIGPITANGKGTGTYNWYDKDMNYIYTGNVYTPTSTKTDTLYVTETINGCESLTDTVIVLVNPLPTADAGAKKHILCSAPTIALDGKGSTGNPFVYSWTPTSGISSGGTTLNPQVKEEGVYVLTVTNSLTKCYLRDTVEVVKDSIPSAGATANPMFGEAPLTVNFTSTSSGSNKYNWDFDDKNKSDKQNPINVFAQAGEYHVTLTSSYDSTCPSTVTLIIKVVERLDYVIPNIFTPNADGHNDIFYIKSTGIKDIEGEIFDRWGLKLYSWNQISAGWDGYSSSGAAAPDGVYFYIIKITPQKENAEPFIIRGHLSLIR